MRSSKSSIQRAFDKFQLCAEPHATGTTRSRVLALAALTYQPGRERRVVNNPNAAYDKTVTVVSKMGRRGKRRKQLFCLKWNRVGSKGKGPFEPGLEGCVIYWLQQYK